jgi:isoquinoline 1-oxidoreductase beta subunit
LFGIDTQRSGMKIAMVVQPPSFGMRFKAMDDAKVRSMPGISDVFIMDAYEQGQKLSAFDMAAFPKMAVIVGDSTWQVMQAKSKLKVEWEMSPAISKEMNIFGRTMNITHPAGLENSEDHLRDMAQLGAKKATQARKNGNPENAFKNATRIIERSYSCPFLAHNTMEPMNFFADVKDGKAELEGPVQTPEIMEQSVAERLGIPLENIDIKMTRMGGGFGRRLYGHFLVEAAVISDKIGAPVKLVYTREDDMTNGVYRPAYYATYKAALNDKNELTAFHVIAGGIPESPLAANRFPAGAIDNYLAETWSLDSNITTGAFRAPRSNFIAGAEQSFLDELAEEMGKDPIDFRLELLKKAEENPVGENNDYDAARYAGVLKLVRKTANWDTAKSSVSRGVSAYYCHNSYVAQVLDLVMENNKPKIKDVYCAVDCGIVVNPDAAENLVQGGTIDGIGHAMYSDFSFKDGKPAYKNFDKFRLIRMNETPKVEVHFIENNLSPTGLGEPGLPPAGGAVANAINAALGKRMYSQPFINEINNSNVL